MGMFCACGSRRGGLIDEKCTCDFTGWYDIHDRLPEVPGLYEVRVHSNSGDIYYDTAEFLTAPLRRENDGPFGNLDLEYDWGFPFDSWDSDHVRMWRPLQDK
jgi:hypothetical protein